MSTASQMVEAALRPSSLSSPRGLVTTGEQECSGERFSKFVKKYSERLLVNEGNRSRSHARRPRGRRAREALKNPDSNNELNLEWVGPAPWDVRIGGDGTPKFLCDVMVSSISGYQFLNVQIVLTSDHSAIISLNFWLLPAIGALYSMLMYS